MRQIKNLDRFPVHLVSESDLGRRGHPAPPPEIQRDHASRHGEDEGDDARGERREVGDRRARTQADEAPADAEQYGAGKQRPVDVALARPGGRAIAALTADS
jgi:hypothetical protein